MAAQVARPPRRIQGKWLLLVGRWSNKAATAFVLPRLSIIISRQQSPSVSRRSETKTDRLSAPGRAQVQRRRISKRSSDFFDETRQFLSGIEVNPLAGLVQISQAPEFLALNPDQILEVWIRPAAWAFFRE
jgi:hypothetical protein